MWRFGKKCEIELRINRRRRSMEKGEGEGLGGNSEWSGFSRAQKKKRNESGREKREAAPCKKAESNHDQARIWASKVRVRTQLRTRNAITRVSNPLVHTPRPAPLDPFLPDPCTLPSFFDKRLLRDQDCISLVRLLSLFLSPPSNLAFSRLELSPRVRPPKRNEKKGKNGKENKSWKKRLDSWYWRIYLFPIVSAECIKRW